MFNDSTPGDPRLAEVIRQALARRAVFEAITVSSGPLRALAKEIAQRYGKGRCHAFTRAAHTALKRLDIAHDIVALRDGRSNIFHSAVMLGPKLLLDATGLISEQLLLEHFEGRLPETPYLERVASEDLERFCSGYDQWTLDQAVQDLWELTGIMENCPAQSLASLTAG